MDFIVTTVMVGGRIAPRRNGEKASVGENLLVHKRFPWRTKSEVTNFYRWDKGGSE
jgi:hypothetical protein